MIKVTPHPNYPAEAGRYIRGNDASPVALAIVLNTDEDKIPPDLERLVRVGVENGAALAGTVQTPNIGFEKIICNIVGNPNIRYLVLGGPESPGHHTGASLKALFANGVDDRKRIVGTDAAHAVLHNIPAEFILRLLQQVTLIDLQFEPDQQIREAVRACYQEQPVSFRGYSLWDPGPFPAPPLDGQITWRVTQPWSEPDNDAERAALARAKALMEKLKVRKVNNI
ncbi:MAG: tetrahydromethanopterin S-methyltransferase subunit A [bacterium]